MAGHCDSTNSNKLLKSLDFAALELLSLRLLPSFAGRDWRSLAGLMEFSVEVINWLNEQKDAVMSLLNKWIVRDDADATTDKLIEYLNKMKRLDVVKDLQEYIDKAPTPEEYKSKQNDLEQSAKARIKRGPSTVEENYDVLICYADADSEFAKLVLKTLEEEPYKVKACISVRDFLPGVHTLEQVVEAIEERCRKVVAILTKDFVQCEKCDHQVKVALSLSPGCRQRRLIPVMYKKCEIPKIMKSIYYLDYTDEDYREYFWTKLNAAIKS